ncbi:MAG: hypothetical protein ACLQVJ_29380, partial [Syntrophobacteraceae bacterium]
QDQPMVLALPVKSPSPPPEIGLERDYNGSRANARLTNKVVLDDNRAFYEPWRVNSKNARFLDLAIWRWGGIQQMYQQYEGLREFDLGALMLASLSIGFYVTGKILDYDRKRNFRSDRPDRYTGIRWLGVWGRAKKLALTVSLVSSVFLIAVYFIFPSLFLLFLLSGCTISAIWVFQSY